jgi:hypothetical protein
MSEAEYEEWFDKYLGDVESLDSDNQNSRLPNIPKPFNKKKWLYINGIILLITITTSFALAFCFEYYNSWIVEWASNALLNLSLGLIASLIIFTYTNHRDRNIAYYTDVLPLLHTRYENMHKAYFDFTFGISRAYQKSDFDSLYEAWHANSNTCFVIMNFFQYLLEVFPFEPKCFKGLTNELLEQKKGEIREVNTEMFDKYHGHEQISGELVSRCKKSTDIGFMLLMTLQELIKELEQDYFSIKYTNRKITSFEKERMKFEKELRE